MSTTLTEARDDGLPSAGVEAELELPEGSTVRPGPGRVLPPALRPGGPAWIWFGIAVTAAGFILIVVAWGQVAAETEVYRQLPYVVSAALVGLGLIMVGLTLLNIATRQRDGIDRDRQVAQLVAILEEVKEILEERDRT